MSEDLSIDAALERLDAWLSQEGRAEQYALRPGASDCDLDELRACRQRLPDGRSGLTRQ